MRPFALFDGRGPTGPEDLKLLTACSTWTKAPEELLFWVSLTFETERRLRTWHITETYQC